MLDINQALIEFENKYSEELMQYQIDGLHIYPCIRTGLFIEIEQRASNNLSMVAQNRNLENRIIRILKKIMKFLNFKKSPYFSLPKSDVVLISSAVNRKLVVDGKNFDKLHDYYARENNGLILENAYLGLHKPPEFTKNIQYIDNVLFASRLKSMFRKVNGKTEKVAKDFFDKLQNFCKLHFSDICDFDEMFANAPSGVFYVMSVASEVEHVIANTKCRYVSIEDCSYGWSNAFLTKLLRRRGITVVEFQHGVVARGHIAYNYGNVPDSYLEYLPEYFLTYGRYWSDVLERWPTNKKIIGNPYLAEQVNAYKSDSEKREAGKNKVLIVSQTTITDKTVALTKELRKLLPVDYSITFRMHPGEVQFREERCAEIENVAGIEINHEGGICDCISTHDFIVGESSTTLFEAIPFEKSIFIMKTPDSDAHIPQNIGLWFENAEQLAEMILNNAQNQKLDSSYYWTLDWQENFRNFFV